MLWILRWYPSRLRVCTLVYQSIQGRYSLKKTLLLCLHFFKISFYYQPLHRVLLFLYFSHSSTCPSSLYLNTLPPPLSLLEMKVNSAYMLMKHNSHIIRLMCVRARACLRASTWQVICTIYPVIPKLHILISQANSSTKLSLDVINVIIQSVLNRTEKLSPVKRPATTELAHWTPDVGYPSSRRHTWSVNLCQTYPSVPM